MSYGSANDSNKEKYLLPLWPEEAASIKEMIKSFTINAAYSVFRENITGSLEEGKNADMVILEKNIQDIPCEEICNVRVMQTIHKGKVVYKR